MLTQEELIFCEEVKNYSLENSGKVPLLKIVCQPHKEKYIFKIEVNTYERVRLIWRKLLGENFDEKLVERDEEFKNCKVIDVLLVGV